MTNAGVTNYDGNSPLHPTMMVIHLFIQMEFLRD